MGKPLRCGLIRRRRWPVLCCEEAAPTCGCAGSSLLGYGTLAKLNALDLVVTVALGSTLATIVLSEDVTSAED